MKGHRIAASLLVVLAAVATVVAQAPKAGSPGGASTETAAGTAAAGTAGTATTTSVQETLQEILAEPTTPDTYRYDPQGRRDPFQSLIGPRPALQGQRPPGVPGFLVDEVKLQGILRTRQGPMAMIDGPDNKGYRIRVGDKLLDGEVIKITPTSVVFRQEVNDPTRIERFREVAKELAPGAAGKQ